MKKAYLKAISYYLPERIISNFDLVQDFPEWSVDKVKSKIGVSVRHVVSEHECASDLAFYAAKKCLKNILLTLQILILYYFAHKVPIIFFRQLPVFAK